MLCVSQVKEMFFFITSHPVFMSTMHSVSFANWYVSLGTEEIWS